MTDRNRPQHKVDSLRATMTAERRTEFDEFCKFNRNTTDIRRLLEDWGYKISQGAVQNWYRATFPIGEQAKRFNLLANQYVGVEVVDALQKMLVVNATMIDQLMIAFDSPSSENFRVENFISMIPSLSREVRACASELNDLRYHRDRASLEVAGAYRAIQELRLIFKDTPFENALDEAAKSVLMRIEDET